MIKLTTMLTRKLCCLCVFFIFFTIAFMMSGEECPCRIDSNAEKADCSRRNLTDVPDCVQKSVKELMLAHNRLHEIRPRQFEKFNKLLYLDLSHSEVTYLRDDAFTGLTALENLDLYGNEISVLNTTAFSKISRLQILNLSVCYIREIKENTFSGLLDLKRLFLRFNQIKYLNACVFAGLSSLKYLELSIGKLRSFSQDVFQPLSKLEQLTISSRPSHEINIDLQFKWLTSLKRLDLMGFRIKGLGAGFTYLRTLEQLNISHCYLLALGNETFNSLKNSPLRELTLNSNHISVVYPSTFTSLKNLEILSLSGNNKLCGGGLYNITVGLTSTNIQYLYVKDICDTGWYLWEEVIQELQLTQLKLFDLSNSCITFIDPWIFGTLPLSLVNLNLQCNYLKYIRFDRLGIFENLQYLNIRGYGPMFEEISDSSTMDANHYFKKQRISSDSDTKISAAKIQETNSVFALRHKQLSASEGSPFTQFDEFEERKSSTLSCDLEMYSPCYTLPYRLKIIDLSKSYLLESVLPLLCGTNNSLEILRASDLLIGKQERECQIQELWKRMKDLRTLKLLDLSGNAIIEIPRGVFSEHTHLKFLSLSSNLLADVEFDIQKLFRLEQLDLSNNRISFIPSKFSQQIETIAKHSNIKLNLQGNVLLCHCDQMDFVIWLLHTRVIFRKDNLTCKYRNGTTLTLSRIADIHRQLEAECFVLQVLLGSIMGFIILILTLSVVAVICHKRWRYKYLSLIARRTINPYHPSEDREILLEYDMYISYDRDHVVSSNETLHELVTQRIYPSLKQRGLKVIIREELDPGRKLFDVISYALRRSRKVVIFLSNMYCKDHWNLFEFNMSVMEGIYTRREVVVPIMLETLKPKDLHEEVNAFLRSGPVARFTFDRNVRDLINFLFESAR